MSTVQNKLTFIANRIVSLDIKNPFLTLPEQTQNSINVDVHLMEETAHEDGVISVLQLEISSSCCSDDKTYALNMTLEGAFMVKDTSDEERQELVRVNGTAILYSVARGIAMGISAQTLAGNAMILPVLDFTAIKNK